MKRVYKIMLLVVLFLIMIMGSSNDVYANESIDNCELWDLPELSEYVQIIDEVNAQYESTLALPSNEQIDSGNMNRAEIISSILQMSYDEFHKYLITEIEQIETVLSDLEITYDINNSPIQTLDTTKKQRAYIGGIGYVEITSDVYYAGMAYRYNYIISYNSGYTTSLTENYYFVANSFNYTFQNNSTECHTVFGGYLRKMNGMILVSSMEVKPVFYAAGGDITISE